MIEDFLHFAKTHNYNQIGTVDGIIAAENSGSPTSHRDIYNDALEIVRRCIPVIKFQE